MPRHDEDVEAGQSRRRQKRESYTPPPRDRSRSREHRRRSEHDRLGNREDRDRYRSRSRKDSGRKRSYSPDDTHSRRYRDKRSRRSYDDEAADDRRGKRRRSRSKTPPVKPFKRLTGALPDQADAFNKEVAISNGEEPRGRKTETQFRTHGQIGRRSQHREADGRTGDSPEVSRATRGTEAALFHSMADVRLQGTPTSSIRYRWLHSRAGYSGGRRRWRITWWSIRALASSMRSYSFVTSRRQMNMGIGRGRCGLISLIWKVRMGRC